MTNGAITTKVTAHPDGTETLTIKISRAFPSDVAQLLEDLFAAPPGSISRNLAHDLLDSRDVAIDQRSNKSRS